MLLTTTRMSLSAMLGLLLIATSMQAQTVTFGSGPNQFNMEFVEIGSPGNLPNTTRTRNSVGSVSYMYQMGKYEVSRDMINKANAAGGLGLTLTDMTSFGGNGANKPATGISWNEAARFVNWLNTSQGFQAAYKFNSYGANDNIALWTIDDPGYNAGNRFRNSQAKYFLPSLDEWHKAAFYDPNADGGLGGYWDYAMSSDSEPTPIARGTAAGTAVFRQSASQGPADITLAGGTSPFGVMGLNGNVWEWDETDITSENTIPSSLRGIRGGSWRSIFPEDLVSWNASSAFPTSEVSNIGFRVASHSPVSVPEPSTWALIGTLTIGLFGWAVKAKRMQPEQDD